MRACLPLNIGSNRRASCTARIGKARMQQQDLVAIAADGAQATATFHCDVEFSVPLPADSTLAQMARLQGQVAERHWQAGRFDGRT